MIASFDIVNLKDLLRDFYVLTKIRITIFDDRFHEIVSYPENIPSFCSIVRSDPKGAENCMKCDMDACLKAKTQKNLCIYQCHAGLTEAITPLQTGKMTIGYLLLGHMQQYRDKEEGWNTIQSKCADYHLPLEKLKEAFHSRKYTPDDTIHSAAKVMEAIASYLCLTRMVRLKQDNIYFKLEAYINGHLNEDLSCDALCRKFQVSRTRLYQISMQSYGTGITDHIRKLRIQKATDLLNGTNLSVNRIAADVGVSDYNSFSKIFKKETGMAPRDYRKVQLEAISSNDKYDSPF